MSFNTPGSPFPAILPMIGRMGSYSRPSAGLGDVLDLYLHGYVSSRVMNLSRSGDGEGGDERERGLPVCVAASHVDGLVLALTPNAHSYNYRSAVLFGYATVVADTAERLFAMELITDGVVPGRWAATRVPPNAAEMQSTSVLKVTISSGSAKIRTGLPHDDRHDLQDADVVGRVWTGVVPVHQTLAAPLPAPHNRVAEPAYLTEFVGDFNALSREQAAAAAVEKAEDKKRSRMRTRSEENNKA